MDRLFFFLVDTGAAVTLMWKDTWDQVTQGQKVDLEPYREQQLVSVDSSCCQHTDIQVWISC